MSGWNSVGSAGTDCSSPKSLSEAWESNGMGSALPPKSRSEGRQSDLENQRSGSSNCEKAFGDGGGDSELPSDEGNWTNSPSFSGYWLGIVAGNPRVTQPGPHPYPCLPVPATRTGLPVETSPKTAKTVEKWLRYEQNNILWRFYSYLSHFSTVSAVFGLVLNVAGWKIHTRTRARAYPRDWPVRVW